MKRYVLETMKKDETYFAEYGMHFFRIESRFIHRNENAPIDVLTLTFNYADGTHGKGYDVRMTRTMEGMDEDRVLAKDYIPEKGVKFNFLELASENLRNEKNCVIIGLSGGKGFEISLPFDAFLMHRIII